jgi:hypothetical protein
MYVMNIYGITRKIRNLHNQEAKSLITLNGLKYIQEVCY